MQQVELSEVAFVAVTAEIGQLAHEVGSLALHIKYSIALDKAAKVDHAAELLCIAAGRETPRVVLIEGAGSRAANEYTNPLVELHNPARRLYEAFRMAAESRQISGFFEAAAHNSEGQVEELRRCRSIAEW
jgi:hypothetical protein